MKLRLPAIMPLQEYARKAQAFADLLPYGIKLDARTILNKNGSLTASYRYRGCDMESESRLSLGEMHRRINDAIKRFGPGWCFHFHSFRKVAPGYPIKSTFRDATSWVIDEERRMNYDSVGTHFENEYYFDLTYLPPNDQRQKAEAFMIEGRDERADAASALAAWKLFKDSLESFETFMKRDLNLERLGIRTINGPDAAIDIDDQLSHLVRCATNRNVALRPLLPNEAVAPIVACMPLRGGFRMKVGDQMVAVITLTGLPNESYPGMFEVLNRLGLEYRATWRFICRDPDKALSDIERERGKWYGKRRSFVDAMQKKEGDFHDLNAIEMAQDANAAARDARSGDVTFGYFTMSIVFFEPIARDASENEQYAELAKKVDAVASEIRKLACQTVSEDANVLEAYLGSLPAIGHAQLRKSMVMSRNLVDFVPTTALWTGSAVSPCSFYPPDSPPLSYVSTTGGTPFNFNVHVKDVGHFFVVGSTGSGKSVLLGFLLAQHRRYPRSRQIVFDVGRSHYTLTKAVGGTHYELGGEGGPSLCPLAYIDDPVYRGWAEGWLTNLCELQGVATQGARAEILKALEVMHRTGSPYSLTRFVTSPYLSPETRDAIRRYTIEGPYGELLDGESDTLARGDFLCFEVQELMSKDRKIQHPVLTYLFWYVERMCDGRPTMLLIDEAWTFLDNDKASEAMSKWLRTMRKQNVAVGFATQNLTDLVESRIAPTLLGNCLTKIYLANNQALAPAAADVYLRLGLTHWQIAQIAKAERMKNYYVTSDMGKRMISLDLGKVSLAFFVSDRENLGKVRKLIEDEQAALGEHPGSVATRPPWQALWLREFVGGRLGQEWFEYYCEGWRERGGFKLGASKSAQSSYTFEEIRS